MNNRKVIGETFTKWKGIFRLVPAFVPRSFGFPGCRLRLHPDDYYALGTVRGAFKERWFASTTGAMNGPLAPEDEGMSYVAAGDGPEEKFLFAQAVEVLGADLVGSELQEKYGGWPIFSKFFDYDNPLFFHIHLTFEAAQRVGRQAKPEAYYFPPQMNNHVGKFPATYFGLDPEVTIDQVRECVMKFESGENHITALSRAYRLELGTGWYVPPGVLHAPGSCLTYEPQWASDANAVYENVVMGEVYPRDFLVENCPEEKKWDMDYILSLIDWEKNVDPHFKKKFFRPPLTCPHSDEVHTERWIVYANPYVAAKELAVQPGQTVTVKDGAAYGCILIQGHGKFGSYDAEAAITLRYGQFSADEFFVSETAAKEGVTVTNQSQCEPMVILKHFGPNHPDVPKSVSGGA